MIRRIFTILAGLSLLLSAATLVLWVRSYRSADVIRAGYWNRRPHPGYPDSGINVATHFGAVHCEGRLSVGLFPSSCLATGKYYRAGPGEHGERFIYANMPASKAGNSAPLYWFPMQQRKRPIGWRFGRWSSGSYEVFYFADAALFGGSLILPTAWLGQVYWRRRWLKGGFCRQCGYDLRASTERCPECGTAIPAQNALCRG